MNKPYEKPFMKMVSLRSNESVADTCWGNHGPTAPKYWDTAGKGYVAFYCVEGSCGLANPNNLVVEYYEGKDDKEPDYLGTNTDIYRELYEKLIATGGGNSANAFKNEEQFPDNPGGMS